MISGGKITFYAWCSFILGIGLASWLKFFLIEDYYLYFVAAIIFIVAAFLIEWFGPAKFKRLGVLSFCSLAFLLFGLWRYNLSLPITTPGEIWYYNNSKVELTAEVAAEPDLRFDQTKYLLGNLKLTKPRRAIRGEVLVSAAPYPELHFGDLVKARCNLEAPTIVDGFAYDRYLAKSDIYSLCARPQLELISKESYSFDNDWQNFILVKIYNFKDYVRQELITNLSVNEADLASGIMLGDQKIMNQDLRQAYARTGLAHIIAISGMNMTFISAFVLLVAIWLGLWRRQAFYLSLCLLWLYTLMIGWPASAVRASLMSSIMLYGLAYGRIVKMERLLVLIAALMLIINPKLLRDDVGFQLSFLALIGIIYFYEPLRGWLEEQAVVRWLPSFVVESVLVTLAAQILTLPIMINNFGQISIVAPLANLLTVVLLGPIMILLFISILLTWLLPLVQPIVFLVAKLPLAYLNFMAVVLARPDWAVLEVSQWTSALTIAYYCCMVYLIIQKKL